MSALVDFVMLRLEEQNEAAIPNCVVVSGGSPAPEVPNCIGPSGKGDCPERWALQPKPGGPSGWWRTPEIQGVIREHCLTHASPGQRFTREQADALARVINAPWQTRTTRTLTAQIVAQLWDDHEDFRPEWVTE